MRYACATRRRYGRLFAIKRCIGRGAWGIVQLTGTKLEMASLLDLQCENRWLSAHVQNSW